VALVQQTGNVGACRGASLRVRYAASTDSSYSRSMEREWWVDSPDPSARVTSGT
jgi:hypothetical protein